MKLLFHNKLKLVLAFAVSFLAWTSVMSLQLPVCFDWRSYNSFLLFRLDEHDASRIKQVYVVDTKIDTLFSSGIRTRVELTNQDKRLDSVILIKVALVSRQSESCNLETAMNDFGQGKGFFLFNRRIDDSLFDAYASTYTTQDFAEVVRLIHEMGVTVLPLDEALNYLND